jgi:hypothetical protein
MEPDNVFAVHPNPETAFAVKVKGAMGAILPTPSLLKFDVEHIPGKPDNLVDEVSRF